MTSNPITDSASAQQSACCGGPAAQQGQSIAVMASPCCGTTVEANESGSCCGAQAKAVAVATGTVCCD